LRGSVDGAGKLGIGRVCFRRNPALPFCSKSRIYTSPVFFIKVF
jgi:hypothetical protein